MLGRGFNVLTGAYSDLPVLLHLFHQILSPSIIFTSITQQ